MSRDFAFAAVAIGFTIGCGFGLLILVMFA